MKGFLAIIFFSLTQIVHAETITCYGKNKNRAPVEVSIKFKSYPNRPDMISARINGKSTKFKVNQCEFYDPESEQDTPCKTAKQRSPDVKNTWFLAGRITSSEEKSFTVSSERSKLQGVYCASEALEDCIMLPICSITTTN